MAAQLPAAPLVGGVKPEQGLAVHAVVAVSSPAAQVVKPLGVYPMTHVGRHAEPLARASVQSPTAPLVGAFEASHGLASHVAGVRFPKLQVD